jgi:hypothetical protein
MEKMESGFGEKSMVGYGVTKQPGHSSGVMVMATGSTCSFVNNRILSFLITPPVNTGGKTNRTKFFKDKENQSSWTGF